MMYIMIHYHIDDARDSILEVLLWIITTCMQDDHIMMYIMIPFILHSLSDVHGGPQQIEMAISICKLQRCLLVVSCV